MTTILTMLGLFLTWKTLSLKLSETPEVEISATVSEGKSPEVLVTSVEKLLRGSRGYDCEKAPEEIEGELAFIKVLKPFDRNALNRSVGRYIETIADWNRLSTILSARSSFRLHLKNTGVRPLERVTIPLKDAEWVEAKDQDSRLTSGKIDTVSLGTLDPGREADVTVWAHFSWSERRIEEIVVSHTNGTAHPILSPGFWREFFRLLLKYPGAIFFGGLSLSVFVPLLLSAHEKHVRRRTISTVSKALPEILEKLKERAREVSSATESRVAEEKPPD